MSSELHLIVGLGNPGNEYARTRHNAGFMVVDRLIARHGLAAPRGRFHGLVTDGRIAGVRAVVLKPGTYMNRSGLSVAEALNFYKLDLERLLIVVDETALDPPTIRLRAEGSPGGHNGLADIERALGTHAYPRLRLGVGGPPGRQDRVDYVLGRFNAEQQELIDIATVNACDAIECWLTEGLQKAMNRFN